MTEASALVEQLAPPNFDESCQQLPVAVLILHDDFKIKDANRVFLELINAQNSDLVGQSFGSLLDDEQRKLFNESRRDLLDPNSKKILQLSLTKNVAERKSSVWVKIHKTFFNNSLNQRLIYLVFTDISEHMFAENYLREAYHLLEKQIINRTSELYEVNERMELAATSAEMGVWDLDLDKQELIWDKWMYHLHRLKEGDFDNRFASWLKLVYEEDVRFFKDTWENASEKQLPIDMEFRIVNMDGNIHWLKLNSLCKKNPSDNTSRMIGICRDITVQKENELLIRQQADYDNLTGLPNRKLFHELLNQEFKESKRDNFQIWLLFLDLDGFKDVNDTLGHHIGDLLLQQVAERLQAMLRNADIVARLGGDEFVVILNDINDATDVDRISSMIIDGVSKAYKLNNEEIYITCSIGIANYPNDADNTADLVKFADQAMYESKGGGKNTYSYFTPALQSASLLRKDLIQDLRKGLDENQFQLFFQPIIELQSGKMYKAEALIRWFHPDKGVISPAAFIPVAEETGIIKEMGNWIFENAFKLLQKWSHALPENFQLSINMSPVQLKSNDEFIDDWFHLLGKYDLKGSNIVIEITEGLLLKNDKTVNDRLLRFADAGIQVAIDDFGTGYSSLSYLQEFNIDYLKIDQSFTQKLDKDSSEKVLSNAIVVMAQQLGLKVIAEGIETSEQQDFLKAMGCDFGQGYLFSRPLPADEFEREFLQ